jgi:hypothetical protein
MIETCCVVDEFCESPANLEPPRIIRAVCYICGQSVCTKCSSRRKYRYIPGKIRMCNNCQIDYDGNDKVVMRRKYKLAGYPVKPII